jgi:hypothetical protein
VLVVPLALMAVPVVPLALLAVPVVPLALLAVPVVPLALLAVPVVPLALLVVPVVPLALLVVPVVPLALLVVLIQPVGGFVQAFGLSLNSTNWTGSSNQAPVLSHFMLVLSYPSVRGCPDFPRYARDTNECIGSKDISLRSALLLLLSRYSGWRSSKQRYTLH